MIAFKEKEKKTKCAKATYLGPKNSSDKNGKLSLFFSFINADFQYHIFDAHTCDTN